MVDARLHLGLEVFVAEFYHLVLSPGFAAFGRKSEAVEGVDKVVNRFVYVRFLPLWHSRFELQPLQPRGLCPAARIATGAKGDRQNLGEQPVMAWSAAVHLRDRTKHQRRAPWPCCGLARHAQPGRR